jgi:hypothetical protein
VNIISLTHKINDKYIFHFTIFCSIIFVLDFLILPIYSNVSNIPDPFFNSSLFAFFVIFFIISNFIFLNYSKQGFSQNKLNPLISFKRLNMSIVLNQFILSLLLILIVVQLFLIKGYYLVTFSLLVYISIFSAIGFLLLLSYKLFKWFILDKNYLILMYGITFCLIILNLLISVILVTYEFIHHDQFIKLRSIKIVISEFNGYGNYSVGYLFTLNSYLSLASFIGIWIPTIILLKTHSIRIGKLKYWALVSIPLIYYYFPFAVYEFGILDDLFLNYGKDFNLLFSIFFGPFKIIGGLLFGLVFWISANKMKHKDLQILFKTVAIGMTILFASTALPSTIISIPPFGFLSLTFVGLASYMLLIGIFLLSIRLSRDSLVRKEIYNLAEEQSKLFRNIGIAQMEKTLQKQVKQILDNIDAKENVYPFEEDIERYKDFINEALTEVSKYKKST